jgi:SAM-dependent methyltransferase
MFDGHYAAWQQSRINKIISIFGQEFFKNKNILELGCGHGYIGKYFQDIGANVTFAEGRQEHLDNIKSRMPEANTILLNQENDWNLEKEFDIVIHWGVLYHIDRWKEDLQTAIGHGKIVFLESEVCDSDDPEIEIKATEPDAYDQAINKIGSRPSAEMIERIILKTSALYKRYDDSDINAGTHKYDWAVQNTNQYSDGQRRFWIIKK